jgi:hypothetical protein
MTSFFDTSETYFDPGSTVGFNGDAEVNGTFTFNTAPVFPSGVDIGAAAQVTYDNAVSGLTATNVQDAIDELDVVADAAMPKAGGIFTGSVTFSGGPDAGGVDTTGTTVPGSNYTIGTYTNVALTGGTGSGAVADITVTNGPTGVVSGVSIVTPGTVYGGEMTHASNQGTTTITGSGTGLRVDYSALEGVLTNVQVTTASFVTNPGGSGYVVGDTAYVNDGGSAGDGVIEITSVTSAGGVVTGFSLVSSGVGYTVGDALTGDVPGGSGWEVPVTGVTAGSAVTTVDSASEFNGPVTFNVTPTFNQQIGESYKVSYDNFFSGLDSTNVQEAIDEIAAEYVPNASFTAAGDLLVGSGAGTYAALPAGAADYILASDGAGGLTWVPQSEGDVTGVTGTAPITVDNTDPQNPIIGISGASTFGPGAVQLNDTVNSTSIIEAATANAAKTAYDAGVQGQTDAAAAQATADAALPKAGGTMTGNIVFQDAGEGVQFNGGSAVYAISDSVSTTSSTTAASSTAVKAAYDAAIAAQTNGPLTSDTVLYVNATDGNNATAARGTDRPFATIAAAIAAASDGDTIFLSAGTFTENFTINKGIHLCGTFCDQATWSGTKILGNVIVNLAGGVTRNLAVSDIYFISANSTSPVSITGMSPGAGGINTFTGCAFTQATLTDTAQFAFQTSGTWTRSLYLRDCTIDGNFRHNAGTAAGASGYIVIDGLQGIGNSSMYHSVLTGTVEYRNPSNTLASVLQTGGVVLINNASAGITANGATTSAIFGGTGFSYKGSATAVGAGTVYFQGGSNQGTGKVDIGANLIYGWTNLVIDPANLTVNGSAVAYTTAVPSAANAQAITQQRPRFDLLKATSSVSAANQLGTVIDSSTGTVYSVTAYDAGTF